jgi:sulfate adenylyltransferase subunit 1
MVTGASTADMSIILVDARHGVLEQTVRHSYISSLLGIPHIVVAINKMDLVDFSEEVFDRIVSDYKQMAQTLHIQNVTFIPISAKDGDNVVNRSEHTPWYTGTPLLEYLERMPVNKSASNVETDIQRAFRFPVQYVIRPISSRFPDFRGYAGRVASGAIHVGDHVKVLPSGLESVVSHISQATEELSEATPPQSVTLQLADDIDISRGDILVKADEPQPHQEQDLRLDVCWFNEQPLLPRTKYIVRQTTFETLGIVRTINYRRNINTLEKEPGVAQVKMNDIAEITIHTAQPLVFDDYRLNRITGSVIFIDPDTNETVGAGMIKTDTIWKGNNSYVI